MTNTIHSVPRELLERVLDYDGAVAIRQNARHELRALLSAPSTAGVDGLEVIGWYTDDHLDDKSATTYSREVADRWLAKGWPVTGIANAADAQAIIDGLRGENERIRLNIAEYNESIACYQSERDQQAQRIGELEGLLRDSAELIKHGVFEDGICCCGSSVDSHGFGDGHSPVDALAYHAGQVCERIESALSAGKDSD